MTPLSLPCKLIIPDPPPAGSYRLSRSGVDWSLVQILADERQSDVLPSEPISFVLPAVNGISPSLRQNHPQPAPRVIQTPATSVISLTELRPATPDTQ